MKDALYLKYRPRRFEDVVGQEAVVTTLKNQLVHDRVFHAYIFTGIRGTGKTTFARILAKAVNCENAVGGEPCGVCDICRGIDSGSMLDVSEIDAASNTGVDDIRELREESVFHPVICKKRVFIIDEVHMLSASAWGALLKIMEEPPEHVMFILATTEIHKVPATILSRCQRFDMRRFTVAEIEKRLTEIAEKESIALDNAAARRIAALSDGAMRDALSLLETCLAYDGNVTEQSVCEAVGVQSDEYLFETADALRDRASAKALERVDALYRNSIDPSRFCSALTRHFRCLLLAKANSAVIASELGDAAAKRYAQSAKDFSESAIIAIIRRLNEALEAMPKTADKRLCLEVALISLCAGEQEPPKSKPPAMPAKAHMPTQAAPAQAPTLPAEPQKKPAEPTRKQPAAKAVESGMAPLDGWIRVIAAIRTKCPMLFSVLDGSSAYQTPTHILIDAGEDFSRAVRIYPKNKDILKQVIAEVTGCTLPIGPYKPTEK